MRSAPRFSAPQAAAIWLALLLGACGEKSAQPPALPPPAPASPAAPPASGAATVILPPSGEITTSVRFPGPAAGPSAAGATPPPPGQGPPDLDQLMSRLAAEQGAGLRGARITVHRAWPYRGYSHLAPDPAAALPARLVAIDLTVEGHAAAFDPDDIEIVDGITRVSYGSDPHVTFIRGPGEVIRDPAQIPAAPAPLRMLLIYAFPQHTRTFTLAYWNQILLPDPRGFESEGWGLPYPE